MRQGSRDSKTNRYVTHQHSTTVQFLFYLFAVKQIAPNKIIDSNDMSSFWLVSLKRVKSTNDDNNISVNVCLFTTSPTS